MEVAALNSEPLIIVGASARAAAFSALRAGFSPYAIDLFADSDLAAVCPAVKINRYPADFAAALAAAPLAPWMYVGGLENHPRLVARLAKLRPLWGNGLEVLRLVRDPLRLAEGLVADEINCPAVRLSPPEPGTAVRWLRKPMRSCAGLGIRRHEPGKKASPGSVYFQEFIDGETCSAVFLAGGDRCRLLGSTDQQFGAPDLLDEPFLYTGSSGPRRPKPGEGEQVALLGESLTRRFGLRGLFNVDYVYCGSEVWPLEVNPRYSASIEVLERALGQNFLTLHAAEFGGPAAPPTLTLKATNQVHCAKRIVYAPRDCVVTSCIEDLCARWNEEPLHLCLADVPRPGDLIRRGQPVASVIVVASVATEAKMLLQERMLEMTGVLEERA